MDGLFAFAHPFGSVAAVDLRHYAHRFASPSFERVCPFEDERRSGLRARPLDLPPVNPPKLELPFGQSNIVHAARPGNNRPYILSNPYKPKSFGKCRHAL